MTYLFNFGTSVYIDLLSKVLNSGVSNFSLSFETSLKILVSNNGSKWKTSSSLLELLVNSVYSKSSSLCLTVSKLLSSSPSKSLKSNKL